MTQQPFSHTALVVETNYLIASVIELPLAQASYEVLIATTPEEAFAFIDGRVVHLAVIDFRLQHGGPEGLVAKLNARGVPFIFCTAASTAEVVEHFPDARVVTKPFSDDDLLAAIRALAATNPSERQVQTS